MFAFGRFWAHAAMDDPFTSDRRPPHQAAQVGSCTDVSCVYMLVEPRTAFTCPSTRATSVFPLKRSCAFSQATSKPQAPIPLKGESSASANKTVLAGAPTSPSVALWEPAEQARAPKLHQPTGPPVLSSCR